MFDIVAKRYWFFGLSLLVIVPGLIGLAIWGLPLAIDFTGGSLLEVQFAGAHNVQPGDVKTALVSFGYGDSLVQTTGAAGDGVIIRAKPMQDETKAQIVANLAARYGAATIVQFENVGPTVGAEVAQRAAGAVGLATLGMLAYISYAFRRVPHAIRYGTAAIIAMLHDVAVVVGTTALLGHFLGWQIDSLFLTALLTVIGFSVHDTIVVFDRIRENLVHHRRAPYEAVVNHSIVQTLDRSINTQLTVMLTLLALALFGGLTIRHFVVTLLIGVFSGTYSSIFNAAPILVVWENNELVNLFRRRRSEAAA
ncbi:MAG: protein translocase subunit SecF [Chloroflexi bacterium]|nr:protein translocase subunit SecF [Chloroflexota bacterium]